jgi:hypothetical protein
VIVIQHVNDEALTTGRMMSSGTNSLPAEVSSQCFGTGMLYYYHWVETSAGGLLVSEDIIRPVVNASALACFITITGSIPLLVDY